jgi:uncharacterized protein YciI
MNRYAFFYFMRDVPEQVRDAVPRHIDYWKALSLADYMGGPFGDRSGGLITFSASSEAEAERLVVEDPFMTAGILSQHWLKPWLVS